MDTIAPLKTSKASPCDLLPEYKVTVMTRTDSQETYGIVATYDDDSEELYVREIGTDKEMALSIVATLNHYRVPYVHFLDVICDLMHALC